MGLPWQQQLPLLPDGVGGTFLILFIFNYNFYELTIILIILMHPYHKEQHLKIRAEFP